ncbi:2-methylaconitate cis-trans isomerase PrpF family protein [Enterococcus sp. DIV0756]|uniref:2-methylaconitate cis-trans isomerase PrpF family protein n=1 Tax=Enterococcus sp. DIV0756 TaxID=2774636 RepID=UPI003F242CA9
MADFEILSCTIMRGGTSKGIFLKEEELSRNLQKREQQILSVFGSPDKRQIDGLGGADVLTSKLAIIGRSTIEGADIDYTFGQVSIDKPIVDFKGNCGNISAAVGPYAIDNGLVKAVEPYTTVNIHMTNTNKILKAKVQVKDGKAVTNGEYKIDGVPGTGSKIELDWSDCTGGVSGAILPTGKVVDHIIVEDQSFEVTLIDAGNPVVFITSSCLGVNFDSDFTNDAKTMALIEKIRSKAAEIFGLVEAASDATEKSPYNPFFAVVAKKQNYVGMNGLTVNEDKVDFRAKIIFMQSLHKAYPITGTIATGIAAKLKGSIVNALIVNGQFINQDHVNIGHPSGIVSTKIVLDEKGKAKVAEVYRTARKIMEGKVFIN